MTSFTKVSLRLILPLRNEDGMDLSGESLTIEVHKDMAVNLTLSQSEASNRVVLSLEDLQEAVNALWMFFR
jgi:hypothetical protein